MRIVDLRAAPGASGTRVSAVLTHEDSERGDETLYFESAHIDGEALAGRPEALVVAALPMALARGERRLHTDGTLCPRLRDGLEATVERYRTWYPELSPLRIEAEQGFRPAPPPTERGGAMLMSGGLDALALLRQNRLDLPLEHPGAIRTGVFVFGLNSFDFEDGLPVAERVAAASSYGARLTRFGEDEGLEVRRIETNAAHLATYEALTGLGWAHVIVSAGLALRADFSELWIASDGLGLQSDPRRAQLHLLPWLSSSRGDVRVGQATWNRLDKAMLVSAWAPALAVLRSCLWHEVPGGGALNCGACEKCVRTMLMLLVHGALERAESFPVADVSPDLVASVAGSVTSDVLPFYPLLLGPLAGIGRADLVEAVEALIASFHARSGPTRRGWLDRLRRPGRG